MGFKALGARERHGRGAELLEGAGVKLQQRGPLHEVEHAEAGRKASRTRRRQHVIGPSDVVTDNLRRI